jgi:erythromycin esterase-like protein
MALTDRLRAVVQPLHGTPDDYDRLLELIGGARVVLLGEASHGTHEFYRQRACITRRLISEKGFTAVAAEADWPAAYRVNRYVRGLDGDRDGVEALGDFLRFPAWMWRNAEVLDFIGWLRTHNDEHAGSDSTGFYGLDLYSLHESMEAVLAYLDKIDPAAARRARERYACFESFPEDPQEYGYAASLDLSASCEDAVVGQLLELRRRAADLARRDSRVTPDEFFDAEQNARTVKNAEQYYRSMFRGHVASWNLRDSHMVETLEAVVANLERRRRPAKIIVWAHNSHLGDARATQMGERGEHNVGQLVRERYGTDAVLVGFTTYTGTVTAASDWGADAERKRVRPALRGSYEALFHDVGVPRFLLRIRDDIDLAEELDRPRLERAIGVIYQPESERASHYFSARIAHQFDAVLHFDETRAVEPLERAARWDRGELPETFPHAV